MIGNYLRRLQPGWGAADWARASGVGVTTIRNWLEGGCPQRRMWDAFVVGCGARGLVALVQVEADEAWRQARVQ